MSSIALDALGSVFAETLAEVVCKVAGFSIFQDSSAPDNDFNGITGLMNLLDPICKNSGILFISANDADMRVLASTMTGVPKDAVTNEDIDDTLCEIVNITAGNAKVRLGHTDHTFALSMPFIIRGENMSAFTKKRTSVISRTLSNDEISLKLKVIYSSQ